MGVFCSSAFLFVGTKEEYNRVLCYLQRGIMGEGMMKKGNMILGGIRCKH